MILLALNYSNAAISLPQAIADPDLDFLAVTLAIVTALCVLAFAVGWGTARLLRTGREQQISLMFALGMNNNGTGLVLASMALADHPRVMLPIIFYNMVQHLVAGGANSLIHRQAGAEPAVAPEHDDTPAGRRVDRRRARHERVADPSRPASSGYTGRLGTGNDTRTRPGRGTVPGLIRPCPPHPTASRGISTIRSGG